MKQRLTLPLISCCYGGEQERIQVEADAMVAVVTESCGNGQAAKQISERQKKFLQAAENSAYM